MWVTRVSPTSSRILDQPRTVHVSQIKHNILPISPVDHNVPPEPVDQHSSATPSDHDPTAQPDAPPGPDRPPDRHVRHRRLTTKFELLYAAQCIIAAVFDFCTFPFFHYELCICVFWALCQQEDLVYLEKGGMWVIPSPPPPHTTGGTPTPSCPLVHRARESASSRPHEKSAKPSTANKRQPLAVSPVESHLFSSSSSSSPHPHSQTSGHPHGTTLYGSRL